MKKRNIALLSLLACACVAGGSFAINGADASANAGNIWMEAGAAIRVPDKDADASADRDGLKFTAYIADDFVASLSGDLSAGMFIMSANYASKPINEENCFGDSAVYYWAGSDVDTTGKKQIIHVEDCYAYEANEGDAFLTMEASVWNLNEASLDMEFVAAAYVTDGTNYYFSDMTPAVMPVRIAQKALLNTADPIYKIADDETAPARVNEQYIARYLGEGKEISYKENVYKQQKDGSYAIVDSETRTVTVTSYDTKTTAGEIANYTFADGLSDVETVMLNGTTEVDSKYNYSANRVVIWNGDDILADADSAEMNVYTKTVRGSDTVNLGFDINPGESKTVSEYTLNGCREKYFFEGKSGSIQRGKNGWCGPYWNDKKLPYATNTFSFMLYSEHDIGNFAFEVFGIDTNGSTTGWRNHWDGHFEVDVDTIYTFDENVTENWTVGDSGWSYRVKSGLYKVTITDTGKTYSAIRAIEFWQNNPPECIFDIDNICIENVVAPKHTNIPFTFEDEKVEFATPVLGGTNVWDGEVTTKSVQLKAEGADEWTTLTATDGKYSFVPDATVNTYELKVVNTDDTDAVYTMRRGTTYFNGNGATPAERGAAWWQSYGGSQVWEDNNTYLQHHYLFGEGFMHLNTGYMMYASYCWANYTLPNNEYANKIGLWVYSPTGGSWYADEPVWIGGNRNTYKPVNGDNTIYAGYHYYEFETQNDGSKEEYETIQGVGVKTAQVGVAYINAVAYVK